MRKKTLITAIATVLAVSLIAGCGTAETEEKIKNIVSENTKIEETASGTGTESTGEAIAEVAEAVPEGTEVTTVATETTEAKAAAETPGTKPFETTKAQAAKTSEPTTAKAKKNGAATSKNMHTGTNTGDASGSNASRGSSPANPATEATETKTPVHVHNWQPVYAKRIVKEAWTETVEKKGVMYERHEISKYHDANGNTIDLTALYNEWYASGVWKNYPRIDKYTQMDIDAGWCDPSKIPELGSYAWFCTHMPEDKLPLEVPEGWKALEWWLSVTGCWYSADVPVERTFTETVEHPAEYEDYVSGYTCSCGATK